MIGYGANVVTGVTKLLNFEIISSLKNHPNWPPVRLACGRQGYWKSFRAEAF
jgi:hypothetical protein